MGILGRFGQSIIVMVIGLSIVFVNLAILIGCIWLMSKIVAKLRKRAEEKEKANAAASTPAPAPVSEPEPVAEITEEAVADDGEIVAVITAAIMAYAKQTNKTLVIRNIRRASGWNRAGRAEQVVRF